MLFFQLLVFCVFSVYAAQDAKLECGTLLLARPYSPGPSTASKPYIPISFNLEKDIKVAHLRPVLEILKKDVELVLIEPTTKTWVVFPLMIKEVFRDDVQESALHEVHFCILFSHLKVFRTFVIRSIQWDIPWWCTQEDQEETRS